MRPRGTPPIAERQIERQRARGDRVDAHLRALVAHAHDRALAELALDLRERALQRGLARLGGLLLFGYGHGVTPPVRWIEKARGRFGRNGVRMLGGPDRRRLRRDQRARGHRLVRRAPQARARSDTGRSPAGVNASAGVAGSTRSPAAPRGPPRMRASVTCGAKAPRSRGGRTRRASAPTSAPCSAPAPPPEASWTSTASARGRRGGSHRGAPIDSSPTDRALLQRLADRLDLRDRTRAEEAERHVQQLGVEQAHGPTRRRARPAPERARAHADSCSRTSAGGSMATNSGHRVRGSSRA